MQVQNVEMVSRLRGVRSRPVTIVGGGAVVSERIVPALMALGTPPCSILVLDRNETARRGDFFRQVGVVYEQFSSNDHLVGRVLAAQAPTLIATWPDSHFAYASELVAAGIPIAVEKPLCANREDFVGFERLLSRHVESVMPLFCLGYYALEKALPLVCCFDADIAKQTSVLLTVETNGEKRQFDFDDVRQRLSRMGRLRALDLAILEGADRSPSGRERHWTEQSYLGGALLDTFVHAMQLAIIVVGEGPWLERLKWADGWCSDRLCELEADAGEIPAHCTSAQYDGHVKIRLVAGKFMNPARYRRSADLVLDNGSIFCDFDMRRCRVEPRDADPFEIAFRSDVLVLGHKYAAQMVQALSWLDEPSGRPPDARESQLAALRTLLSRDCESIRRFNY